MTALSSLLSGPDNEPALEQAVADARARAFETGRTQWLALRSRIEARDLLADLSLAFASTSHEGDESDVFYWEEADRGRAVLGLGRLTEIAAMGPERFANAGARSRELFRDLRCVDLSGPAPQDSPGSEGPPPPGVGPLLLGGFGFNAGESAPESEWHRLGPGRLVLPEHLMVRRGDAVWLSSITSIEASDTRETTLADVRECAARIDARLSRAAERASFHEAESSIPPVADVGPLAQGPEIRVRADRLHAQYRAQVTSAVEAIEAGKFEKVVLARSLVVAASDGFEIPSFLGHLREIFPSCAVIALKQDGDCFVSASPERLVCLEKGRVETVAVAGSAPRGRSPQEEERFSQALLSSSKERVEHEVVKRAIRAALKTCCTALEGPDAPELLKLEGIQHLATPLEGRLMDAGAAVEPHTVLDLVSRLHPTPAVCGAPTAIALDWLEQFEALDRGWYAGPIGFVDSRGDGEFRVALRSALLQGNRARLFAGAGIVADSDPERELAETRLKLRALLAPLTEI
jgi:isochorismate synthase